jgi:hypothetical protein
MIRVVLGEVLLELAISLYAVDQGFIATLHSQQRIHGSTTNRGLCRTKLIDVPKTSETFVSIATSSGFSCSFFTC